MAFWTRSSAGDPRVVRTSFAPTPRPVQPLLIVAIRGADSAQGARAQAARARDGEQSTGEVEGKEACLELLREIVWARAGRPRRAFRGGRRADRRGHNGARFLRSMA